MRRTGCKTLGADYKKGCIYDREWLKDKQNFILFFNKNNG